MVILHISDTHGRMSKPFREASVVVHTGDLLPNKTRGDRYVEPGHQTEWLRSVMHELAKWVGTRPFLFMPGNHDFVDPCPGMRRAGIDAHNLHEEGPRSIDGVTFGGVPFVPYFGGEWNYEVSEAEIDYHLSNLKSVDVLVTHCPPLGVLDDANRGLGSRLGRSIGSKAIHAHVEQKQPRWHLCGHVHECGGSEVLLGKTRVVNSAGHAQVLTWKDGELSDRDH